MENITYPNSFIAPYSSQSMPSQKLFDIRIIGFKKTPVILRKEKGSPIYFMAMPYEETAIILNKRSHMLSNRSFFIIAPEVPYSIQIENDSSRFSWIRFSGKSVKAWLSNAGISLNKPMEIFSNEEFENGLQQLHREMRHPLGANDMHLRQIFQTWLSQLKRSIVSEAHSFPTADFIKVKRYIENNFTEPLTLAQIQSRCAISQTRLIVGFKRYFNVTPMQYVTQLRMRYACELLSSSSPYISGIAEHCGYSDPLYFSKVFKATFGKSPIKYHEAQIDKR